MISIPDVDGEAEGLKALIIYQLQGSDKFWSGGENKIISKIIKNWKLVLNK